MRKGLLELFCEKICEDEELKKFGLSKDNIVLEYGDEEFERFFERMASLSVLINRKPMTQDEYSYFSRGLSYFSRGLDGITFTDHIKYSLHLTTKEQYEEIDKIKGLVCSYIYDVLEIAFPVEEVKEEEEQSSVKEEEQSSVKEEEKEHKPVQPSDGEGSYSTPLALFIFGVCSIFFCLYYYA